MNRQEIQELLVLLEGAGIKFNRTQTPPQYPEWEFGEMNYGSMVDRGYDATSALQEAERYKRL